MKSKEMKSKEIGRAVIHVTKLNLESSFKSSFFKVLPQLVNFRHNDGKVTLINPPKNSAGAVH